MTLIGLAVPEARRLLPELTASALAGDTLSAAMDRAGLLIDPCGDHDEMGCVRNLRWCRLEDWATGVRYEAGSLDGWPVTEPVVLGEAIRQCQAILGSAT